MLTWVVLPPDFDSTERYPALLYCQGGPQSVVSQFWSYRWNLQLMAAQGYVVVAPNRRGVPSFGQQWLDQISGDYSGQNIRDYLSAIDDVAAEPWVDGGRLGCVGGELRRIFGVFSGRASSKTLQSFYSPLRDVQSGEHVRGDRGTMVSGTTIWAVRTGATTRRRSGRMPIRPISS